MSLPVVGLSDLHTGSQTGLCTPVVETDSGSGYKATPLQKLMYYQAWLPLVEKILALPEFGLVLDGDIVDLDVKKRGELYISTNPNDIVRTSLDLLSPLIKRAKWTLFARGTSAHVGLAGCYEEQLATIVNERFEGKVIPYSETTFSHQHITRELDGLRYDITHHPEVSPGKAQTTRATYTQRLGVMVHNRYVEADEKPPHVVIRGHAHFPAQGGYRGIRVFGLPAWQWPTEFVYRIGGADVIATFGALIGDELELYRVRKRGIWQKI